MKKNKLIFLSFFGALLLFTSCKKWLDINEDPNNPTVVGAENILPVTETSIGGIVGGNLAIIGGLWSQHWTQSNVSSQYKTIDAYAISSAVGNRAWTELYAGALNDLKDVKGQAEASGNWNLYLQATVLEAYAYQTLVDFFNSVPYSEALNGVDNANPIFDSGKDVYAGLLASIDEALSKDFEASTVKPISTDLVFGSLDATAQVQDWKKFANTLKLKILLRESQNAEVGSAALAAISSLLSSGAEFLDKDAGINQFIDEPGRSNFLYENNVRQLNTGGNLRLSRTFQSFLEENDDLDRLNAYFNPGSNGQYGLVQGDYEAPTTTTPGGLVSIVKSTATDPFFFISHDESLFLQAEAKLRTGDDAESEYNQAVSMAYMKFGLTVPAGFLESGGAYEYPASGTTAEKIEAVMTQKWVAMFKQGTESFLDQARTGIPKYSPVPYGDPSYVPGQWTYSVNGVTIGGAFPKRLLYPDQSLDVNSNAPVQAQVTDKIWWMPN